MRRILGGFGEHRVKKQQSESGVADVCLNIDLSAAEQPLHKKNWDVTGELSWLSRTIESEIIPRLKMTFPTPQMQADSRASTLPGQDYDVADFTSLLLRADTAKAFAYVERLREFGYGQLDIYSNLLAPTAKYLGELWIRDDCSFTDVTIGVCRMRQMLLAWGPIVRNTEPRADAPTALIAAAPEEQHTFGLFLVVEQFREAGWEVWAGTPQTDGELRELVSRQRYDVIGFSVATDRYFEKLRERIALVRQHSVNPSAGIILGGSIFEAENHPAAEFAVELITANVAEAVAIAQNLADRQTGELD